MILVIMVSKDAASQEDLRGILQYAGKGARFPRKGVMQKG